MRLSSKRREAIYRAIHEEVMRSRLDFQRLGASPLPCDVDRIITRVVGPAYRRVMAALNATEEE